MPSAIEEDELKLAARLGISKAEVALLAALIAEQTWRKMRKYIARQQRELHDLYEEEE